MKLHLLDGGNEDFTPPAREPFQLVRQRSLVYNDMALDCILQKQYEDAITLLNRAIEAETKLATSTGKTRDCVDYRFFVNRGDCYRALGKIELAIADFHRAYDSSPDDWQIKTRLAVLHYMMGVNLFNKGEFAQAEVELSMA